MQTSLDYTFSKALEDLNRLQEDLTKDTRIQLHDEQGAIIGEAAFEGCKNLKKFIATRDNCEFFKYNLPEDCERIPLD